MRGEVKRWYQTKKLLEKEDIKTTIIEWMEFILKLGIAVGAIITWIFYFFYIGIMPSIGNIGDITIFLLMIAGIGIFISSIFIFFHLASSLSLRDETNFTSMREALIRMYFAIPLIIHLFGWSYIIDLKNNTEYYLVSLCFITMILYFLAEYKKFLIPYKHVGIVFIYYLIYIAGLSVWSIFAFQNFQKDGDFLLYFIDSLLIIFITISNIAILKKDIDFKISSVIIFSLIYVVSQIFSAHHIPNPIIVYPFSILKLGYYNAELHFKDDFINKSNPFPLNETNQTSNTFFILSSVGDEYILRETRQSMEYNESNISHHTGLYPFDYNGTRYYCEDNNQSLIWVIPDSKNKYIHKVENRSNDFNETIEKQLEYWKTIDRKIYRIKKDNVEFEVVGKEIETQSTIWKHNAKN